MPPEAKNEEKRVEDDQDGGVVGHSGEVVWIFDWCSDSIFLISTLKIFSGKVRSLFVFESNHNCEDGLAIVGAYYFGKEQKMIPVHTV